VPGLPSPGQVSRHDATSSRAGRAAPPSSRRAERVIELGDVRDDRLRDWSAVDERLHRANLEVVPRSATFYFGVVVRSVVKAHRVVLAPNLVDRADVAPREGNPVGTG